MTTTTLEAALSRIADLESQIEQQAIQITHYQDAFQRVGGVMHEQYERVVRERDELARQLHLAHQIEAQENEA